jgi:hypothetical protein
LGLCRRRVVGTPGGGYGRARQAGEHREDEYLPRRPEHDDRRKHRSRDGPLVGKIFRHFGSGPRPRRKTLAYSIRRAADNRPARPARLFDGYILDFTEAAGAKIVGSFPLPGFTYGLAVSGGYAYLANSDTGLHILDIRNPKAPAEVGALKLEGEPSGLAVQDGIAYVASGPAGLLTIDVRQPSSPKVLGAIPSDDFSSAVALDGDFAFVADGNAGVKKINISRPAALKLESSYDTPGEAQNLFLAGKLILVADTYSLLILK